MEKSIVVQGARKDTRRGTRLGAEKPAGPLLRIPSAIDLQEKPS